MKNTLHFLFIVWTVTGLAQVEKTSVLYQQMKHMDSIIFQAGFNNCDMEALEKALTEDLEFYHDIAGTQNKSEFLEAMAINICGNTSAKITRALIPESLEVFPLKNNNQLYGSFVTGAHEFFRKEAGQETRKTGYAKFTSYYTFEDNTWKLKRAFSFDHKAAH